MMPFLAPLALLATLQEDPATHHSPDSVLYLEIPDVPAALEAYGRTALIATVTDPELAAAVGRVLGVEGFDPVAMLVAEYEAAVERGDMPPLRELLLDPLREVSVSVTAPEGQLLPLLLGLQSGTIDPGQLLGKVGVQVEVEMADGSAASKLADLIGSQAAMDGVQVDTERRGTARIFRFEGPEPALSMLALVQDGPHLGLVFGSQTPEAFLARLTGDEDVFSAPDPEDLTGRGTTVLRYHATFAEQALSLPQLAKAGILIDMAEGLVGPSLTMLLRGGKWRVGIEDSGRVVTEGVHPRADHPLDQVFASQPLQSSDFNLIHPDAIVGWVVHFDTKPVLALIEKTAGDGAEHAFPKLEEDYDFRPDKDLLAPLGSALAYSLPAPQSLLAAPPLMVSATLADRDAFIRGMDGLGRWIRIETEGDFELSSSEYRGMRLYSLEIDWSVLGLPPSIPIDPSGFFKPTMAVCPEHVFITTLPNHAKREIRRLLSADEVERTHEFPKDVTSAGFADWVAFLGNLYTSARAMAPMLALAGDELPFDPTALPSADQVTGHFGASWRWKRNLGDGQVLHFQESSFGPEAALSVVIGAGAAVWGMQGVQAVDPPTPVMVIEGGVPPGAGPEWHSAKERAGELRGAVFLFHVEQGEWPRKLSELTKKTSGHPEGYLVGGQVGSDPWGGAYHLAIEDERPVVWCNGPNGRDEDGGGDDVVAR